MFVVADNIICVSYNSTINKFVVIRIFGNKAETVLSIYPFYVICTKDDFNI